MQDPKVQQLFDQLVHERIELPFLHRLEHPDLLDPEEFSHPQEFVQKNRETLLKYLHGLTSRENMKLLLKSCATDRDFKDIVASVTKRLCKIGLDVFSKDRSIHFVLPRRRGDRSIASIVANFVEPEVGPSSFRYTSAEMKAIYKLLQKRSNAHIHFYAPNGVEVSKNSIPIQKLMDAFAQAKVYKDLITREHPNYSSEQIRSHVKRYLQSIQLHVPIL